MTVRKTREKGGFVEVVTGMVFGTAVVVGWLLSRSRVSRTVNTSFVEKKSGTRRRKNSRKVRKTYGFSKDYDVQDAASYFLGFSCHFYWPVRTLRERGPDGRSEPRTLAMAAGLADQVWTIEEWATYPARPP